MLTHDDKKSYCKPILLEGCPQGLSPFFRHPSFSTSSKIQFRLKKSTLPCHIYRKQGQKAIFTALGMYLRFRFFVLFILSGWLHRITCFAHMPRVGKTYLYLAALVLLGPCQLGMRTPNIWFPVGFPVNQDEQGGLEKRDMLSSARNRQRRRPSLGPHSTTCVLYHLVGSVVQFRPFSLLVSPFQPTLGLKVPKGQPFMSRCFGQVREGSVTRSQPPQRAILVMPGASTKMGMVARNQRRLSVPGFY